MEAVHGEQNVRQNFLDLVDKIAKGDQEAQSTIGELVPDAASSETTHINSRPAAIDPICYQNVNNDDLEKANRDGQNSDLKVGIHVEISNQEKTSKTVEDEGLNKGQIKVSECANTDSGINIKEVSGNSGIEGLPTCSGLSIQASDTSVPIVKTESCDNGPGTDERKDKENVASSNTTKTLNTNLPNASERRSLTVKLEDDLHTCFIVGISITRLGTVLLADLNNRKLKAFSYAKELSSYLKIPHGPLSVAVVDDITALVSANNKKIYTINISEEGNLSATDVILLDFKVLAIAPCGKHIAVTTMEKPRSVKMVDRNGSILWSLTYPLGEQFESPDYIATFGAENQTVIVSDYRAECLTVLKWQDGLHVKQIDRVPGIGCLGSYSWWAKPKWYSSRGLTFDKFGNMYITYPDRNQICVISEDFIDGKIILSLQGWRDSLSSMLALSQKRPVDCGQEPTAVACSAVTDELFVSYNNPCNFVDCFKLSYADAFQIE